METLYRDLAEDIKTIEQYNQSMDSASWGYEEGILITGNDAKEILKHTAQLQADKAEMLMMLEKVKMGIFQMSFDQLELLYPKIESLIKKMKQ